MSRRLRGGSGGRAGGGNRDPLRKIVGRFENEYGVACERLECGHTQHVREDYIGPTNAYRRRCSACARCSAGKEGKNATA